MLLVTDANVFIDLEEGGLLEALFELDHRIATPDLLFVAELRENHADLLDAGLELIELSARSMQRVVELATRHPRPGRLDLTALAAAQQESCPIVTGDAALRDAARSEGVRVYGTLWICGELVHARIRSVTDLREAYRRMRNVDRRLPWDLVDAQLRTLSRT